MGRTSNDTSNEKGSILGWVLFVLSGLFLVGAVVAAFLWGPLWVLGWLGAVILFGALGLFYTSQGEPKSAWDEKLDPEEKADRIERYLGRQDFEHQLIDRKVNWLLASQGFLFAAYGFSATAEVPEDLSEMIASVGLALAVIAFVELLVHIVSKVVAWRRERKIVSDWGVITANTMIGAIADILVPAVFISVWIILGL